MRFFFLFLVTALLCVSTIAVRDRGHHSLYPRDRDDRTFLEVHATYRHPDADKYCGPIDKSNYLEHMPTIPASDYSIGYILTAMLLITNFPQLLRLVQNSSMHGVSKTTYMFYVLSSLSSFLTVLVLNYNYLPACEILGFGACHPYFNIILYGAISVTVYVPMYVVVLYYYANYDRHNQEFQNEPEFGPAFAVGLPVRSFVELVSTIVISVLLVSLVTFFLLVRGPCDQSTRDYGTALGVISTVFVVLSYIPQIVLTAIIKTGGQVSLVSLSLQLVVDVLAVYYYYYVMRQTWAVWVSYIVEFISVLGLILMILYYDYWTEKSKPVTSDDTHFLIVTPEDPTPTPGFYSAPGSPRGIRRTESAPTKLSTSIKNKK